MLTGVSATKGKSSDGNPGEGEERRSAEGQGRREWKCSWTKRDELGVGMGGEKGKAGAEAAVVVLLGAEEGRVPSAVATFFSHSLRSKLTHSHACLPFFPGAAIIQLHS